MPFLRVYVVSLIALTLYVFFVYEPYTWSYADAGWQVSAVQSLVEDGDLDLRNQLQNEYEQASDQVAIGASGEWYPLHELPIIFLAVPFYILLGVNGCLALNIMVAAFFAPLSYALARAFVGARNALFVAVLALFSPVFVFYSYSFSVDVLGAILMGFSLLLVFRKFYFFAGLACGLAVLSRLVNVCGIPPLLGYIFFSGIRISEGATSQASSDWCTSRVKSVGYFMLGGAVFAVLFGLQNYLMFGSPVSSSYHNWIASTDLGITQESYSFSLPSLEFVISSFWQFLLGVPQFIVGVTWGVYYQLRKNLGLVVFNLFCFMIYFAFSLCFDEAFPGSIGDRYLLFPALAIAPLVGSLDVRSLGLGNRAKSMENL